MSRLVSRLKPSRKPGRKLSAEELRAKRKKDFWTLDLPLVFGLILCTTFTFITGIRGLDGNGRALAYAFQWPVIGAIIVWIWYRYKREGLTSDEDETQSGDNAAAAQSEAAPKKKINPIKLKQLQDRVVQLEADIASTEAEMTDTEAKLSNYSNADESARLGTALAALREKHEKLLADWESTSEALAEVS